MSLYTHSLFFVLCFFVWIDKLDKIKYHCINVITFADPPHYKLMVVRVFLFNIYFCFRCHFCHFHCHLAYRPNDQQTLINIKYVYIWRTHQCTWRKKTENNKKFSFEVFFLFMFSFVVHSSCHRFDSIRPSGFGLRSPLWAHHFALLSRLCIHIYMRHMLYLININIIYTITYCHFFPLFNFYLLISFI